MASRKLFSDLKRHGRLKRLRRQDLKKAQDVSDDSELEETSSLDGPGSSCLNKTTNLFNPFCDSPEEIRPLEETQIFDLIDNINDCDGDVSDDGRPNEDISSSLRDWSVKFQVKLVALTALLSILKSHNCFKNMPGDARTLLKTPSFISLQVVEPGHYFHFGIKDSLKKLWSNIVLCVSTVQLLVGVDGISLFKSSGSELWPIMAKIVNVPSLSKNVFPIGVYYGKKKPDSCVLYLSDFVTEISDLICNGLVVNGTKLCVQLKGICCDAPAKSFILGIKGHTGYSSCTRCKQKGKHYRNRVIFPDLSSVPRTSDGFLSKEDECFHTKDTPLVNIPGLNFVSSFPLDYMHLVCLGVVRSILYIWMFAEPPLKLQFRIIDTISSKLISLQPYIPFEFSRRPRSLIDIKRWKATEFRQFLLYTGPIVLYNALLPSYKDLYDNFLTLQVSLRILLSPELCHSHQTYAKDLLKLFVTTFQNLYGKQFMSHNFHNLLHLADDVSSFGNLDSCSAFPFENYLFSIKKLIRKGENPLQQVVKRIIEISNSSSGLQQQTQQKDYQYNLPNAEVPHFEGPLLHGCVPSKQFKVLHFNSFKLTTSKPNNCCILSDGSVVIIKNIVFSQVLQCFAIICNVFLNPSDFYGPPLCPSSALGIQKVKDISPSLQLVPILNIKCKALKLPLRTSEFVVMPILHCETSY